MPEPNHAPIEDLEDAADLPDRRAMSLLDPGTLLGGAGGGGLPLGGTPTPAQGGTTPTAPAPPIPLPHVPVPTSNPGGTYSPDATAHT
jgi:hypothetical protein